MNKICSCFSLFLLPYPLYVASRLCRQIAVWAPEILVLARLLLRLLVLVRLLIVFLDLLIPLVGLLCLAVVRGQQLVRRRNLRTSDERTFTSTRFQAYSQMRSPHQVWIGLLPVVAASAPGLCGAAWPGVGILQVHGAGVPKGGQLPDGRGLLCKEDRIEIGESCTN